jgi:hypothetical protein
MGSHHPFGHLKHKLWPKEGLGINLAVWLLTSKSRESTQFPCVQVACHIPLKSLQQGLQFCFRPHFDRRLAHKVMGLQSRGSLNFDNFETPTWESREKNAIWIWALWSGTKYTIRGKVMASPKSGSWWVLWVRICSWLVLTPKVLKLCTNHLVLVFLQVRVSSWCLSLFLVPSRSSSTPFYPSKCCEPKNMPRLLAFSAIFSLDSHFSPLRSLGVR